MRTLVDWLPGPRLQLPGPSQGLLDKCDFFKLTSMENAIFIKGEVIKPCSIGSLDIYS